MPAPAHVKHALRSVIDPEVGVNIVDLGLVVRIECDADDIRVELTMTSPSCPMGEVLRAEVEAVLATLTPGRVAAHLVWTPAWTADRMSHVARKQLGWT